MRFQRFQRVRSGKGAGSVPACQPHGEGPRGRSPNRVARAVLTHSMRSPSRSQQARLSLLWTTLVVHVGARTGEAGRACLHVSPPKDTVPLLGRAVIPAEGAAGVGVPRCLRPGHGAQGPLWRGRWYLLCCPDSGSRAPDLGQPGALSAGAGPRPRGHGGPGSVSLASLQRGSLPVFWGHRAAEMFSIPEWSRSPSRPAEEGPPRPLPRTGCAVPCAPPLDPVPWPLLSEDEVRESWGAGLQRSSVRLPSRGRDSDPFLLP